MSVNRDFLLGSIPDKRFVTKVIVAESGCWEWTGAKDPLGYGSLSRSFNGKRKNLRPHRYTYEFFIGPIPADKEIDHLCRNPSCCNPAHLEAVTHHENVMRGETEAARRAAKTHCKHGHEFTPENTGYDRRGNHGQGWRYCKSCRKDRVARFQARNPGRWKEYSRRSYWKHREAISERRRQKRQAS